MLFQYYHNGKITYFQFIQKHNFFQDLNLLQIQKIADEYGVFLSSYLVKWHDFSQTSLTKPLICQVKQNNKFHFIIIYEKKKNVYLIADPGQNNLTWININDLKMIYTGIVLRSEKTIWLEKKENNHKNSLIFWNNLFFPLIIITLISIFITGCTIFGQFLIKMIIDDVLVKRLPQLLVAILLGFIILFLQKLILKFLFNLAVCKVEINFKKKWNLKFLNRLQNLSFVDYQKYKTSNILQNYYYFNEILHFYFPLSLQIIQAFLMIVVSLSIIMIFNIQIVLPILFLLALFLLFYSLMCPWIRQHDKVVLQTEKKWQSDFLNFCKNYLSYKNRNLIALNNHYLLNNINQQFQLFHKKNYLINLQLIVNELFAALKTIIVSYLLLGNKNVFLLNPGTFIFLFALINNIIVQSQVLFQNIWYATKISNLKSRVYPFLFVLNKQRQTIPSLSIQNIKLQQCNISLNSLHNLWKENLTLSIKNTLVVYGSSGSGKTIFLQILSNYWKEYKGQIIINQQKLQMINVESYQNEIYLLESYAPIENGTVFKNITTYQKQSNVLKIWKENNLDYFLNLVQLSAGSEITNETISSGQRQIINFLALFFRSESLILLDESLNSIPLNWKAPLLKKLLLYQKNKIFCYATHDPKIAHLFNQKIILTNDQSQN